MELWRAVVDFVSTLAQVVRAALAFRMSLPQKQDPPPVVIQVLAFALLLVILGMMIYASVSIITVLLPNLGHA